MPRIRSLLIGALALLSVSACHKGTTAAHPSLPPLLIEDRGFVMPLSQAVTHISYRPYIPRGAQILAYAVIPPLGDQDTPANRGIAIEYEANRRAWLLSQWPKQNFILLFLRGKNITDAPCTIAHYKKDGVAWTTHGKLAMTLQPDGSATSASVEAEARRLFAAGACAGSPR